MAAPAYKVSSPILPTLVFFRFVAATLILLLIQNTLKNLRQQEVIKLQNHWSLNENLAAGFEILKQQVNPHFPFNELSTLRTRFRANDEKAETFFIKLPELYRELLH